MNSLVLDPCMLGLVCSPNHSLQPHQDGDATQRPSMACPSGSLCRTRITGEIGPGLPLLVWSTPSVGVLRLGM